MYCGDWTDGSFVLRRFLSLALILEPTVPGPGGVLGDPPDALQGVDA